MFMGEHTKPTGQASLSTSHRNLSLRHAQTHALPAHVASLAATQPLCSSLDTRYTATTSTAIQTLDQMLPLTHHIPVPAPANLRQQQLSQALDRSVVAGLASPDPGREAFRAHLHVLTSTCYNNLVRVRGSTPHPPKL